MLDLIRLSPRRIFPPGGEALYRRIASLAELAPGTELLDVACGKGVPLEFFALEHGVRGTGVDPDPRLVAEANERAKRLGLLGEINFQEASPDDLPFRDASFDVVIGEVGLAARSEPRRALGELIRVLRPGGRIVLVQLVWIGAVDEDRKRVLSEHLGARPLMAVELRRILLDHGIEGLLTEDWTDESTAFRAQAKKPFPDFAELFSVREKIGVLRRAWGRWGWRGVRSVLQREAEVHRLLTRERILGLNLLIGSKPGPAPAGEHPVEQADLLRSRNEREGEEVGEDRPASDSPSSSDGEPPATDGDRQASGLPLFGSPQRPEE